MGGGRGSCGLHSLLRTVLSADPPGQQNAETPMPQSSGEHQDGRSELISEPRLWPPLSWSLPPSSLLWRIIGPQSVLQGA